MENTCLDVLQICSLQHTPVLVFAPTIPDIDGQVMICDGSRKVDGTKYVILNGEEYSFSLFLNEISLKIMQNEENANDVYTDSQHI